MNYPLPQKKEHVDEYFGALLSDPYYWLKEADNPEVLEWVKKENEFTDQWFDQDKLQKKIEELKAHQKPELYMSIHEGKEYYTISKAIDGDYFVGKVDKDFQNEEILYKRNDIENFLPFQYELCPCDNKYAVLEGIFAKDPRLTALVVNTETKEILTKIEGIFGYSWSQTKPVVYYANTKTDVAKQQTLTQAMAYNIYEDTHKVVYADDQNAIIGSAKVSSNKKHVIFEMMKDYSNSRFLIYQEDNGEIYPINTEAKEIVYLDSLGDTHYFLSREENQLGSILAIAQGSSLDDAVVTYEVDPNGKRVIEDGFVYQDQLYIQLMNNVSSQLIRLEDGKEVEIALPDPMGSLSITGKTEEGLYVRFESFLLKPRLYRFDGKNFAVVQGEDKDADPDLIVEQFTAPSVEDKTEIPYYIVHRKDAQLNGNNPLWIYAYGGYNISSTPSAYDPTTVLDIERWVKAGGVYVVGSLRGGNEFGTKWHEDGMLMKKKNCYYDFIGIAEQLIQDGWTNPKKIVISGMSNGGLLMSTLTTMRPDLWGCVIDSVPHTDMIHFMEDDRGPMYITEYGNPLESKEMYEYLLSYSPYYNVKETEYPCMYIQTGECDNNVPPYHGKKFAARVQELNQSDNPILFRVLKDGAHDRGAGEVYWKTIAEMQLFVEESILK